MRQTTILIADGDPHQLALYSDILRHAGYHTLTASRADTAVRVARLHRPAAVVTEIVLTGSNGFEVVRAIRRGPSAAAVPVLVLTGRESASDRREAEQAGCSGYLVKPSTPRWLLQEIRWQLQHSIRVQQDSSSGSRLRPETAASRSSRIVGTDGTGGSVFEHVVRSVTPIAKGQRKGERGPHTGAALDTDLAPMGLHDSCYDRQPEPGSPVLRPASLPEAIEQMGNIGGGDSGACVLDREDRLARA